MEEGKISMISINLANRKKAITSFSLAAILALIVVGAVVGTSALLLGQRQLQQTATSSNMNYFGSLPTSAETTNSTLGLKLSLSVNSTSVRSGSNINVTVTITNVLKSMNNVSGKWDWANQIVANSSASTFPCPHWDNFVIVNGYYSESNISTASPLWLIPPHESLACPYLNWTSYLFKPQSYNATVFPNGYYPYNLTTKALVQGYYTTPQGYVLPNKNLPPPPFPTGIYTIAAGDEWGQMVILHIVVVSSSYSTDAATTLHTSTESFEQVCTGSTPPTGVVPCTNPTYFNSNTMVTSTTIKVACTHTIVYKGKVTCSAPMNYSTLNQLVHNANNSFANYGNGTIILYAGHPSYCTVWFYYLPNETSVIEYLGVTGNETCV